MFAYIPLRYKQDIRTLLENINSHRSMKEKLYRYSLFSHFVFSDNVRELYISRNKNVYSAYVQAHRCTQATTCVWKRYENNMCMEKY